MSAGGKNKDSAGRQQMSPSQSRKEKEQQKAKEMEQDFHNLMQKLADKLNGQLMVADEIKDKNIKNKLLH